MMVFLVDATSLPDLDKEHRKGARNVALRSLAGAMPQEKP